MSPVSGEEEKQRRIDGYKLATESIQRHSRKMEEARRAAAERDAREAAVCYDLDHDALATELQAAREALRKDGACVICRGDGKPRHVNCDDYQTCQCRPNQGINLPNCWSCSGDGLSKGSAARAFFATHPDKETEG